MMLEKVTKFQDKVLQCMKCDFCMYFRPGCMIQLLDHTSQQKMLQRVVHMMELLSTDQA